MAFDSSDDHFLDLLTWLEQAGHEADARKHFVDFCRGQRTSCQRIGYSFAQFASEGILQIQFWFPFTELEKACPINDQQRLEEWLTNISGPEINAEIKDDKKLGKCVLITRRHYIPEQDRSRLLSSGVIPESDSAVLSLLLTELNPLSPDSDDRAT